MDLIRPWLYIGKYSDTRDGVSLRARSITAMLQLAEAVKQPDITSLYLPVEDTEPIPRDLLQRGISFVHEQKKLGGCILVACGAGINRSSSFCTAVLKEDENLSLFDAFKEVKRLHPESAPHLPAWESLCKYYGEAVPYHKIMSLL